jgi:hypothetical protein
MPASHFDVNSMTGRPKFIVRHSTSDRMDSILDFTNIIETGALKFENCKFED